MRVTATGLAAAVLFLVGTSARAQPAFLCPAQNCVPANPTFYGPGYCLNCWYGPNYCYQGPCLPAQPFNGVVPVANKYPQGQMPGYAAAPGAVPGMPGLMPGLQPPGAVSGIPPHAPPPIAGPVGFATHPFARSPRDFFMYGQQYND